MNANLREVGLLAGSGRSGTTRLANLLNFDNRMDRVYVVFYEDPVQHGPRELRRPADHLGHE